MADERWTSAQKSAINGRGGNIIVSAAAGSGKTSVLSERVARYIADGGDADKILVVTFTKAAAKEMRGRIISKTREKSRAETDISKKKELTRQCIKLNNAKISTMDSFFSSVVRENFRDAEVSPNFGILEQVEADILFDRALTEVLAEEYEKMTPDFSEFVSFFGADSSDRRIPAVIKYLADKLSSVPFADKWLEERKRLYNSPEYFAEKLCEYVKPRLEDVLELLEEIYNADGLGDVKKSIAECDIRNVKEAIANCETNDWDGVVKTAQYEFESFNKGSRKGEDETCRDAMRFARNAVKEFFKKEIFGHNEQMIKTELELMSTPVIYLFELTRKAEDAYFELCKEKNKYSFATITTLALKLLVSDYNHSTGEYSITPLAEKLRDNLDEIMIDEYQDTNGIQDLCFSALGRDNLFVVGDAKQAIYGFRGSDPAFFIKKSREYNRIDLNMNFRSREGVLDFSNTTFRMLFSEEIGGLNYGTAEQLNYGNTDYVLSEEPDVKIDIIEKDTVEADCIYAQYTAAEICKIMETANSPEILKKRKNKAYTLSDIAVMLPKNKHCGAVEKALRNKGIPSFYDGGDELFDGVEVNTVIALLEAVDEPYNDIYLLETAVGGIFEIPEEDIGRACIKRDRFLYDELRAYAPESKPITDFFTLFDTLRVLAADMSPAELIRHIYTVTDYPNRVLAYTCGSQRYSALMSLYDFALKFADTVGGGLHAFLDYVRTCIDTGKSPKAPCPAPDGDYVHLMTIHKSKGLEYPICIIPYLDNPFSKSVQTAEYIKYDYELGVGTLLRDESRTAEIPSFLYEMIKLRQNIAEKSEKLRQLYVAFTRARELLILQSKVTFPKKKSDERGEEYLCTGGFGRNPDNLRCLKIAVEQATSFTKLLKMTLPHRPDSGVFNKANVLQITPEKSIAVKTVSQEDIDFGEKNVIASEIRTSLSVEELEKRFNFVYDDTISYIPAKVSVTELVKGFTPDEDAVPLFDNASSTVTPRFMSAEKMTAAERGTAMHKFVSLVDFEKNSAEELRRLVHEGIISEKEAAVINPEKVERMKRSEIFGIIKNANKVYREEPFVVRVPAGEYKPGLRDDCGYILMQGAIDLLCEYDDGFILVDYKTDGKSKDELIQKYSKQLHYYAMSVQKLFRKPVKKSYIWSFALSEAVEVLDNN